MNGKEKCRILRDIRQQIARENDIELITAECSFKGECRGTCPKCESELRYLEAQLEKRRSLNKRIALAGVSAGLVISLTGCSVIDALIHPNSQITGDIPSDRIEDEVLIMGEVPYIPTEEGDIEPLEDVAPDGEA